MLSSEPFLTAYDPSDLPGASIDPLGFDRGYQFLADSILPGITNVANRPRYWSVLCAAVAISDQSASGAETARQRLRRRQDAVQRLERFWAFACVRAAETSNGQLDVEGIRGLRYVQRELRRQQDGKSTNGDYKLLARQLQYGLVGIYSSVAERLLLIHDDLGLQSEFGQQLAQAFTEETKLPEKLEKAVVQPFEVPLDELTEWGRRAHHTSTPAPRERDVLRRAFEHDDVRRRMGRLLRKSPPALEQSELERLAVIEGSLEGDAEQHDLYQALRAIRHYEQCYRLCMLAFLRLLWLVQSNSMQQLATLDDRVIADTHASLQSAALDLHRALRESDAMDSGRNRWCDALEFVDDAARSATVAEFVTRVLERHRDVQQAKYDRGIRKTPWLEIAGGSIRPTLSQAQDVGKEPKTTAYVRPHEYRTLAADRLIAGGDP